MHDPLKVDVVSDFVCPWCWIGKRGLDGFSANRPVDRRWRPYFLHPGLPSEGTDRKTLMLAKFGAGADMKGMAERIAAAGAEAGVEINYLAIERVPNTTDAHRLARWAGGQERGDEVAEGLFRAYFSEGRDIGKKDVLADIGEAAGLDRTLLLDLLAGDADRAAVEAEAERARDLGISGVPTQVIEDRLMLVGAQSASAWQQAILQLGRVSAGSRA